MCVYIRSSREKVLLSHNSKQAGSLLLGMSPFNYRSTNNRTKALMRQGYGYRNRQHLRLRILLEHGT